MSKETRRQEQRIKDQVDKQKDHLEEKQLLWVGGKPGGSRHGYMGFSEAHTSWNTSQGHQDWYTKVLT